MKLGDKENILKEDQAIFSKKLKAAVTNELDYPANVGRMLDTFLPRLDDETFLVKCLLETKTSQECCTARSALQDSLVRLLLNIEDFQPRLLRLLLEKLAQAAREGRETNLPQLILKAVRWLDVLVDGAGLVEKIQEILEVATDYHRLELIMALPEILPRCQHDQMAARLLQLLQEPRSALSAIVDCFGNLSLSQEMRGNTQTRLIGNLARYEFSVLPAVVEYILTSCTKENCEEVVLQLRRDLELTAKVRPSQRAGPSSQKKKEVENKKAVERLLLDKIGLLITIEKFIAEAWFSAVESIKEPGEMKPLDFLVIVLMFQTKQKRNSLVKLVNSKIRTGVLTQELIIATFENHSAALQQSQFLSPVLEMAVRLLRSALTEAAGKQIFISAFSSLDDFSRLEIVTELSSEVTRQDSALATLSELSLDHTELLSPYSGFLMPLLDQLDHTDLSQARLLIALLARLTWSEGETGDRQASRDDNLVIFVKKQVSSGVSSHRRMGVVGTVICARAMIRASSEGSLVETSRNSADNPTGLLAEAHELISSAQHKTQFDPELAGLLLDELSLLTDDKSCIDFIEQITARLLNVIETNYVEEVEKIDNNQFSLPMVSEMGLVDEDKHCSVVLAKKVLECSADVNSNYKQKKGNLVKMIPTFRLFTKSRHLIASVSNDTDNPLEQVDALLGCCLLVFPRDVVNNFKSHSPAEKNSICSTYFYAINWLIEVINAYGSSTDETDRKLVLSRLKQIIILRKTLGQLLNQNLNFKPPTALFSEDHSHWKPPGCSPGKKKADNQKKTGKGKGRGKQSKGPVPLNRTIIAAFNAMRNSQASQTARVFTQTQTQTQTQRNNENQNNANTSDLQLYRIFFREFDLDSVLSILESGDFSAEPGEGNDAEIRPPELFFLLSDLCLKLESVTGKKKGFPGKSSLASLGFTNLHNSHSETDMMKAVMRQIKSILSHLDKIKQYFEEFSRAEENETLSQQTIELMECMKVGLQTLNSFFAWDGFRALSNGEILRKSFLEIAGRVSDVSLESDQSSLVRECLKYLRSFSVCSLTADTAAAHLRLMSTLAQFTNEEDRILKKLASKYLAEDWRDIAGEKDEGGRYNAHIQTMLKMFVENSSDLYRDLSSIVTEGTSQFIHKSSQPSGKYPFISKGTLSTVYKVVLPALVSEVKKITFGPRKDAEDQLSEWTEALDIYVTMITDLEKHCSSSLLSAALKHSRTFISHFVKQGKKNT